MMRRTFLAALVAAFVALVAMVVTSERAAAQVPIANACCNFTVDVAGFKPGCFPVQLTTRWTGWIQTDVIAGNGVFVLPINVIPCPPAPAQFGWASLDGGLTLAWFNFPATTIVNGCCFTTRIGVDAAGCIIVYLRPC